MLDRSVFAGLVDDVPDEWLLDAAGDAGNAERVRGDYVDRLVARLDARAAWVGPLRELAEVRS